ncbi:MAG: bacterial Ig-like domain-containing protein [Ruminococcus sp.]
MYISYSAYSGAWVYSDFSYDKTEPLTTADTAVTFDYHGFKVQQKITVTAKKPSKLSVITAPDKTDYSVGDKLDLSGLRLRLTYNNGNKSPAFTADQLEQYGVKIALGNDGKVTPVSAEKIFTADDNGQTLLFYATDALPGTYGTVTAVSETIHVAVPLSISGVNLHLSAGKTETQYIDSGSDHRRKRAV